ncbi:MAG: hypothetical protein ACOY2B_06865 [Pseudomonadota bacterium]
MKLAKHPDAPDDLFCELYREIIGAFEVIPDVTALADIIGNPDQARSAFRRTKATAFRGEVPLLEFMERAHGVMVDLGGDPLANRYFLLTEALLDKYSLRYDLRRPFSLNTTLAGVFARLIRDLKDATVREADLHPLMVEFEDAVRDLRADRSAGRIKTCIQKQVNLLEAIGQRCPGVTANTLGQICEQVGTWPHNKVKDAMKCLYGFASDYPGIRHGGTANNGIREIEMRDLVGISVLLAGFSPYLTDLINSDSIYRGT